MEENQNYYLIDDATSVFRKIQGHKDEEVKIISIRPPAVIVENKNKERFTTTIKNLKPKNT